MRTSVLFKGLAVALVGLAVALVVGSCVGPDSPTETNIDHFLGVARGANTIPPAADTLAEAVIELKTTSTTGTLKYSGVVYPSGSTVIDSIFMYTIAASAANYTVGNTGATTYVAPSVRVCGTGAGSTTTGLSAAAPPACAADADLTYQPTAVTAANGTVTTNTNSSLTSSLRAFGQQVVFFTSGASYKRGKIRGTPYLAP